MHGPGKPGYCRQPSVQPHSKSCAHAPNSGQQLCFAHAMHGESNIAGMHIGGPGGPVSLEPASAASDVVASVELPAPRSGTPRLVDPPAQPPVDALPSTTSVPAVDVGDPEELPSPAVAPIDVVS